jgi:hypothetical protein
MASTCEHEAIEQIRGLMKREDFFDVFANNMQAALSERVPDHYADIVEINKDNASDFRIICRKCHLTTGWMKADAPGYPGALKEVHRKKWHEIKGYTPEEWTEVQRKSGQRTSTDIRTMFPSIADIASEHGRPIDQK